MSTILFAFLLILVFTISHMLLIMKKETSFTRFLFIGTNVFMILFTFKKVRIVR